MKSANFLKGLMMSIFQLFIILQLRFLLLMLITQLTEALCTLCTTNTRYYCPLLDGKHIIENYFNYSCL